MLRRFRYVPFALAAGLLLAACGAAESEPEPEAVDVAPEEATEEEATEEDAGQDTAPVDLAVADSPLGEHLVDGRGFTLYVFDDDEPGVSNCTGECLANWPPAAVTSDPSWAEGVDGDLVGTIERGDDGSIQLTYDGMPLYLWVADAAPGDATGQGVNEVWWVLAPDGTAITTPLPEPEPVEDDGGGVY